MNGTDKAEAAGTVVRFTKADTEGVLSDDVKRMIFDALPPLDLEEEKRLPASQRGRFVCTESHSHLTLMFDNGDLMWVQPGTAALFEGMCQGEESDGEK